MSVPSIVRGQYLNLMISTAIGPPEVFAIVCGLTTRSFTEQVNTSDTFVRDCAAPENIPARRVNVTGAQWDLSGTGLLNRAQLAIVRAKFAITANWRMDFGQPTGDVVTGGGGHFDGPALLESIKYGAQDGEFVTVDLSLKSDGAWTWTPVP